MDLILGMMILVGFAGLLILMINDTRPAWDDAAAQ